jgi:DNA-binding LacI/PurR family transcriptional regulator
MPFSEYYQSATEYGDRHLKIYYGMVDRAMELGFNIAPLLFPPAGSPEAAVQAAIDEITFKYAGIIHLGERGCYPDIPLRRLFDRQDIPQISIDCETGRPWIGSVALDPDSVAHMAYNLFREYGHSRICLVYHALDYRRECSYMMIDRESVTAAFRKTKIDFGCVSELVTNGDRFDARFDKALSGLLASRDAPTAFWCRNDVGAMEIIKRLVGAGYEVPGDFSVLGFGDQSVAKSCVPALTTLRNQLYEIGSTAVSRLIDCIRHGLDGAGCVVRIPPSLVLRDSVGPKSRPFAKESSSETGNIAFI